MEFHPPPPKTYSKTYTCSIEVGISRFLICGLVDAKVFSEVTKDDRLGD